MAVRYPKGEAYTGLEEFRAPLETGKAEVIRRGSGVALLAVGAMVRVAEETAEQLKEHGLDVTLVNMRFVKPFDRELLKELSADHSLFVTMEENVESGGFGQQVMDFVVQEDLPARVCIAAIPDCFVGHGSVEWQRRQTGLDADSVTEKILDRLGKGREKTDGQGERK